MEEKYDKIRGLCKNIQLTKGKLSDEYLFTLDAVDTFFYKNNIGAMDIRGGFTDGSNDGGIDFIYSDGETMFLVQGKSTTNLSIEDIKNLFNKMAETTAAFYNKKYEKYSNALKTAFWNKYDDLSDDKNIALVLFTSTLITEKMKREIDKFICSAAMGDYAVAVYDADDIEARRTAIFQQSDLVPKDAVELYTEDEYKKNILHYGENGIIVNIKASSLKHLFTKHSSHGLFSYNLREHITQKSVDQGIERTIEHEAEKFWFYNNGITIGCGDFHIDGTKICLYDFSIINGAQTTTKIGKSKRVDEEHDFAIVCKIVRAKNSLEGDSDFITKISEASNSQKPIRPRDLKANSKEQKLLQMGSAKSKYPLAIEIKRGVKAPNYKKVEKWQHVTNDYIGQLIYACIFQHPGLARNSKNTMYSSSKVYNQLFLRKHDYNTLYDLVRLGDVYDDFSADFSEKASDDLDKVAIASNGKLSVLAAVMYLYKKQKGLIDNAQSAGVHRDNVKGLLVTDYQGDDLDKKLRDLFAWIIKSMSGVYEKKKVSEKITSYSNFFKSEKMYDLVLREFDEADDYDQGKINSFMEVFSLKKEND